MRESVNPRIVVIVVMGVTGAGKTTVGQALAAALGWSFMDADDFHSPENIARMHRGEGLTDDDRRPWLAALRRAIDGVIARHEHAVLACSALKQWYRDELCDARNRDAVRFVHLDVPVAVLRDRLEHRQHHFAPPELLDSQLATLEVPHDAVVVDGAKPVDEIVLSILHALRA